MISFRLSATTLVLVLAPGALFGQAARVDSLFARYAASNAPGCAVGVAENGRTVLARAYGMANLEHDVPNTPETVFEAGSVSKQFTAAAVVLLAARGRLSLDDDVRRHVPEVPDYGRTITLRHLLNHTSGLRDWGAVQEIAGSPRGTRTYSHAHVLDIVGRQRSLNFAPGTEYSYSNTGYNLLAVIVERVSGVSFAEFSRREIFAPLGMTRTEWRDDYTRVVKGRAVAYEARGGAYHQQMPFENVHGNGGLLTTVGDLLAWNQALATDRFPGLRAEMERQGVLEGGRRTEYALGLRVAPYRGLPEVSHSGATAGYRAYLTRFPAQDVSIALLCNRGDANPVALGQQLAAVFVGRHMRDPAAEPATALAPEQARAVAGMYASRRTAVPQRVRMEGDTLRWGGTRMVPVSATRFRLANGNGYVQAEMGSGGRASSLRLLASDGDTVVYDAVPPATPTAAELAAYAGEYRSAEAEVAVRVEVVDGKLVLRRRPDTVLELAPAYADAFLAPGGVLVRFIRQGGSVREMSIGMDRVRDLRFARVR
ncbi:MAG TPA: serine hydrolase domain-containing protein [Longimicrobium sp.]|jgi:CubicO group peptidase (beta-lactamase class C family)